MSNNPNVVDFPKPDGNEPDRSVGTRWKHPELFAKGYLALPILFLHVYATLKPYPLTVGEAMFVLHLMEYKWDERSPFPSYKALAKKMAVSDKMVRRHAQSLEAKKYLRRVARVGNTNEFDLTPLFDALLKACIIEDTRPSFKALFEKAARRASN
ncbi:MAG TPA: helix-turn-helix domain-containing protein [Pyrinomonadaceae bacterium]|nr:helix-turn-helix domain-containing protein [Pyrinomonadaceae bacterium]